MQDSLLSLHIMTGCDTTSVLQPRENITCKLFKEHRCLAKYVSAFNISQDSKYDLNRYSSATFVWCSRFHLTGCIHTLCIYTCHGHKVCQWLFQTKHTIPQLVLQLVENLPHQPFILNLVSCKCKTGCCQGYGCCCAGACCSPMCTKFIRITCTNTSQDL